jgi:hypothetical protein
MCVISQVPKIQEEYACFLLHNLASCFVGKKRILEVDGMEYLLAATKNHLNHADTCERACSTLMIVVADSNENTERFLHMNGANAVVKIKNRWPGNYRIQTGMCHLSKSIAAPFIRWGESELRK